MRVLQIINSLASGGAEKLILETLPLYNSRNDLIMDLLVFTDNDYPFMTILKKTNCCKIYIIGKKSVYDPRNIFKLIPYFKKYDIIHVNLFPAQYWVVLAKIISLSKIKIIFTEHSTSNRRLKNLIFGFFDKIIYRFFDKIICISYEIKEILINHTKLSINKFCIIENGINLKFIYKSLPIERSVINSLLSENDKLIIQVSSFREPKDHETLLKAMLLLPNNIKLILAGDGPLRVKIESLSKKLELETRVLFLGLRMDVPNLLKSCDIIVLSSKYEGLSLSSLEGMASGKPFLASNVPGLKDIVNGAGLLFEQGNASELSSIILKLINNSLFYDEVVLNCKRRASQYDIIRMVEKHVELYNEVLNK